MHLDRDRIQQIRNRAYRYAFHGADIPAGLTTTEQALFDQAVTEMTDPTLPVGF